MIEKIDINISFDTPLEDIEALRAEIENFVQAPENKRDFQPDVILQCNAVGGMDKLQLTLHVRHKVSARLPYPCAFSKYNLAILQSCCPSVGFC